MLDHNIKEFDDHFRGWSDEDLAFAALLGIVDRLEGVGEDVHAHHGCFLGVGLGSGTEKSNGGGAENTETRHAV